MSLLQLFESDDWMTSDGIIASTGKESSAGSPKCPKNARANPGSIPAHLKASSIDIQPSRTAELDNKPVAIKTHKTPPLETDSKGGY